MFSSLLCVDDVEKKALPLLPKQVRDYYQGGADDEATLKRNKSAYKKFLIRPKCLEDVSHIRTSQSFKMGKFHFEVPCPVGIAPSAFHRMAHDEGEKATAKAAGRAKTIMILSSLSTTSMEDVAKASQDAILWFQLYVYRDKTVTKRLIERAFENGYKAIVLTVDAPIFGRRREDSRNAFQLPPHLQFANFSEVQEKLAQMPDVTTGTSGLWQYAKNLFDESINWKDLKWLVETSPLPVVVKGVMRGDDAVRAVESGAAGVIVSNHGGRQLDFAPSTVEVLPEVMAAVSGRVPVFVDGGVRSGNDVFKAMALGAQMVFVGRPVLWGLTVGGSEGVSHVLDILKSELEYTMKLSGHTSIEEVQQSKNLVVPSSYFLSKL
ncbi:hypothetical protein QR680_014004 [Steinernema hermaphroditum]|uniref:FMN hydroxy acid dehydrogenase domain-containing protein n=1 Tax=Steinernema hermaphroditum TaxID=289476 RepID=A0AA39M2H4_9BILA|nr:hypothetical protein QR680_014004 [Steinernema hermaphroditum]